MRVCEALATLISDALQLHLRLRDDIPCGKARHCAVMPMEETL